MNCCPSIKNKFLYLIMPGVVGIATSGLIFQFIYFLPAIQKQSTRIFLETTIIALYVMCFISYYYAINIKNSLPETLILPRNKSQLKANHPMYTQKKQCQKQNQKYKPPRTSHCHVCKCVTRMDHHCPYTDNCVGSRNLKAFILFVFYGGLFAFLFLCLSIFFYNKLSEGKINKISELTITIWMILSFVSFILTISMNGLAYSNIYLAGKNITQLQMLKGHFFLKDRNGTHPNPYDLGFFTNINIVFGGDYWMFWWPSAIKSLNDFTEYPMRPPITAAQLKQLPQNVRQSLQEPFARSIPKTLDQLRKNSQQKYDGVVFFYLGKPYYMIREEIKQTLNQITSVKESEIQGKLDNSEAKISKEDEDILTDIYKD